MWDVTDGEGCPVDEPGRPWGRAPPGSTCALVFDTPSPVMEVVAHDLYTAQQQLRTSSTNIVALAVAATTLLKGCGGYCQ